MTLNDQRNFPRAIECYLFPSPFNTDKVRDHVSLKGK